MICINIQDVITIGEWLLLIPVIFVIAVKLIYGRETSFYCRIQKKDGTCWSSFQSFSMWHNIKHLSVADLIYLMMHGHLKKTITSKKSDKQVTLEVCLWNCLISDLNPIEGEYPIGSTYAVDVATYQIY